MEDGGVKGKPQRSGGGGGHRERERRRVSGSDNLGV